MTVKEIPFQARGSAAKAVTRQLYELYVTGTKTSGRQEGEIYLGLFTVSVFTVGKHGRVAQPVAVGT